MNLARVLLADDHDNILDTVTELLEPMFQVVSKVANGRDLIAVAETLQPDVLILDISLPDMSGIEAADLIRKAGNAARVIFLTVHSDSDFIRSAFAVGAFGYVIKSRMVTDLTLAIHEALAGRVFVSSPLIKAHSREG